MRTLISIGMTVAACSSAPTCEDVAAHLLSRDIVLPRCQNDGWSDDARRCARLLESAEDLRSCYDELSMNQGTALQDAFKATKYKAAEADRNRRIDRGEILPMSASQASLVIRVRDTRITVADKMLDEAQLGNLFRAAFTRDKLVQIVIDIEPGSSHATVVKIMELAKLAGLSRIAIATRK